MWIWPTAGLNFSVTDKNFNPSQFPRHTLESGLWGRILVQITPPWGWLPSPYFYFFIFILIQRKIPSRLYTLNVSKIKNISTMINIYRCYKEYKTFYGYYHFPLILLKSHWNIFCSILNITVFRIKKHILRNIHLILLFILLRIVCQFIYASLFLCVPNFSWPERLLGSHRQTRVTWNSTMTLLKCQSLLVARISLVGKINFMCQSVQRSTLCLEQRKTHQF